MTSNVDKSKNDEVEMKEEDEDEDIVVKEIDVYISKSLANNIYILQVGKYLIYFKYKHKKKYLIYLLLSIL